MNTIAFVISFSNCWLFSTVNNPTAHYHYIGIPIFFKTRFELETSMDFKWIQTNSVK